MKLNILWMYHDMMDLYGDTGNIQVLKKRCELRNITCVVDTCTMHEEKNLDDYDIIFIGGGADKEQSLLYQDLLSRKDQIVEAMNNHTFFLLICGGYQFFGKHYIDGDGNMIEGLGIFDYYTETTSRDKRCIGNVVVEATLDGESVQVVGFENHGGQTKGVNTPFANVIKGHGNEFHSSYEGFLNEQVLGTYLHGPLLPKNPKVADYIIRKGLLKHHQDIALEKIDDHLEEEARKVILKRYQINKSA